MHKVEQEASLCGDTLSECCSVDLRYLHYCRISPTSYPDAFAMIDEHVRPRWPMAGEPLYRWSGQASLASQLQLAPPTWLCRSSLTPTLVGN